MSLLDKILNGDLFKAAHGRYADTAKNRRLHRVGQEYGHAAKEKVPGPGRKPAQQDDEQKNPLAAKLDTLSPTQLSKIVETSEKKIQEFKDKGYGQGVQKLEEIAREAKKRLMGDEAYEKKDLVQRVKDTVSDEKDAGKVEQDWEDRLRDYISEHYPTQANVTAETNSPKGREEREKMKNDPELKRMLEQQGREFKEADKKQQTEREKKEEKPEEKKTESNALDEIQKRFDALKGRIKELKKDGYDGEGVQAIEKQYRSLRRALRKMRKKQTSTDTTTEKPAEKPAKEPKTDKKPESTGDDVKVEARMAFDDIPMLGNVKMAKYLSDKRRSKVDKDFESIKNLDRDTIQTLHDGLVKKFNDGFDGMAKADRAEALYKIAKVKNELQKRPAEPFPKVKTLRNFTEESYNYNTKSVYTGKEPKPVSYESLSKSSDRATRIAASSVKNRFEDMPKTGREKGAFVANVMSTSRSAPVEVRKYQNHLLYEKGLAPVADSLTLDEVGGVKFKSFNYRDNGTERAFQKYLKDSGFKKGQSSFEGYINDRYSDVRDYLENGNRTFGVEKIVGDMDRYFSESNGCPDDISLERVLSFDDEYPDRLNYLMDANVGDEFEDKSYASYSMGSDSVGRSVDFKITLLARKGQGVLPIYSNRKQGEREFIANRGSKYRVLQKGFNSLVVEMV